MTMTMTMTIMITIMTMKVDEEFDVAHLARVAGGWTEVETTCKKVKVRIDVRK